MRCSAALQAALLAEAARSRRPRTDDGAAAPGGGAVLTGRGCSVLILLPGAPPARRRPVTSYRWLAIERRICMRDPNVPAQRRRSLGLLRAALALGVGEGTGEKIVGLAQLRRRTGVLLTRAPLLARPRLGSPVRWSLGRPADDARALAG